MEFIFWSLIFIVFYTYMGYGILLFMLVKMRGSRVSAAIKDDQTLPEVTHIIAAYNEEDFIREKIKNSLSLDYPKEKYNLWVVTDGSSDRTMDIVKEYESVKLFHQDERRGKIHAVNRVMPEVKTPITIYSDANTHLNQESIEKMMRHFQDPQVGCVAGEKRIYQEEKENSTAGEGIYWKYESFLKKYDYQLYSVVGAAGELFSIRANLFEKIAEDTLIEDFYLSLNINKKGYRTAYEPAAYAMETSSESVKEESKRKIRIAAGGFQAIWRLRGLFNIFKYGWLSFQFISHRVLRWTIAPLALPFILLTNILLAQHSSVYFFLLIGQLIFYLGAIAGFYLQRRKVKIKAFFIPFYFTFMNTSVYLGFIRYLRGSQSVLWERAKRKS